MKNKVTLEQATVPTANIAVNKSRVKLYNKEGDMPTYYLQKGQEFQIELFNPTQGNVLAKIILNGNAISQGGLVIKPGQRIFLDRYIDVAKKFLFDTYEVSNTAEVKEAIKRNGDFKVEFYREKTRPIFVNLGNTLRTCGGSFGGPTTTFTQYPSSLTLGNNTTSGGFVYNSSTNVNASNTSSIGGNITLSSVNANSTDYSNISSSALYSSSLSLGEVHDGSATMDWMQQDMDLNLTTKGPSKGVLRSVAKKSIETGRVEEGSKSDQKLKTVNMDFEYWAFHTIECKMLPVSQKINTSEDINVKRYCTGCGAKLNKGDKFCAKCGKKN